MSREFRNVEIRIGPIGAPINRIETNHVSSAREIVCRINNSFKTLDGDDSEAMRADYCGGKRGNAHRSTGRATDSRLLYGRERSR